MHPEKLHDSWIAPKDIPNARGQAISLTKRFKR